jgi:chromobox protein 1
LRYVVESINGHKFVKGSIQFHVKWQGYDDDADMTWEPEENLETAPEVLKEYYDTIGGRPQAPSGSKKRGPKPGAKRTYSESNGGTPEASSGRGRKKRAAVNSDDVIDVPRKKKDKYPPKGDSDWDKFVDGCDTIEVGTINHNGVQEKFALLRWEDGQITKNTLRIAHKCAPQAVR